MKNVTSILTTSVLAISAASASFEGPSLGAQLGMAGHSAKVNNLIQGSNQTKHAPYHNNLGSKDFIGGLNAAWDKAFNNKYVLGLEAFGNFVNGKMKINDADSTAYKAELKARYAVGVVGRAGVLFNNALAYVTVGYIGSQYKFNSSDQVGTGSLQRFPTNKKFLSGVRAGVGMATMVTECVKVAFEGTYNHFQKMKVKKAKKVGAITYTHNTSVRPRTIEAQLKLSYQFKNFM